MIINKSQADTEEIFKEDITLISDYSLHFQNMQFDSDKIYENFEDFYSHLQLVYKIELENKIKEIEKRELNIEEKKVLLELERLKKIKENCDDIFYDINYTFVNNNRIQITLKKKQLVERRKKFEFELYNIENLDELKKKELEIIIEDLKSTEERLLEDYKKSESNLEKVDDIFVTFKSTEQVEILKNAYKKTKLGRCCTIFCCNRKSIEHL